MNNDNALRPDNINSMIGATDVRRRLQISINAAKQRGDVMPHTIFSGPAGTGKTSLAFCVAKALGTELIVTNATMLKEPKDLLQSLRNVNRGDVFFIDEAHNLKNKIQDFLLTVMEDFRVDIVQGSNKVKVLCSYPIEPITVIGATTHIGLVAPTLRDRFRFQEELSLYSPQELSQIIKINAAKLGKNIAEDGAMQIAIRSRGTPRIAINYLFWIRDFTHFEGKDIISGAAVDRAMTEKGVDKIGLVNIDRRYISVLFNNYDGGPAGLQTLASSLNTVQETIADSVEPYLMQIGLVGRSSSGRFLTTTGLAYARSLNQSTDNAKSMG